MNTPRLINFKKYKNENGQLCVYECGQLVPFNIRRVFTVSAKANDIRGMHAHKQCTQLLICLFGKIRVTCDDGSQVTQYELGSMDLGLLVPPSIWAIQEYLLDDAVLMVLCDRIYEADDYIHDYKEWQYFLGIKDEL